MSDGTCMISVASSSGHDADSPVVTTGWVVPRGTADEFLARLRDKLGPPQVESIGTLGGHVDSYKRSQREGTALYLPGDAD